MCGLDENWNKIKRKKGDPGIRVDDFAADNIYIKYLNNKVFKNKRL